jgi:transcriptional regulator with XRE-family HTH domain
MNIQDIIKNKYGSVENMYREKKIKLSRMTFYRILYHDANPTLKTLQELAELLDVSLEELIQHFKEKHEDKLEQD